uniref:NADH-ubiquinone oxidoreductase chain 4 n=1 Tax=Chamaeleo chamaeleon musae TaxID=994757 RepID=H9LAK8_CHACM|nr:NADH dehydrogenase subunit 4 [Chamaeleo chamaeleon musae]ADZ36972.1 NADH dehydrogenase subunit 4 [Chamaeleo chamaeleon musae]ADZ36985.1 NADH dehydrogenase subunit 4 [Chamaeleo chamaeleon musae]
MLKILIPTMMLIPSAALMKKNTLHPLMLAYSTILATLSLQWLKPPMTLIKHSNPYLSIDQISAPLLTLSYWLLPIAILASQNHLKYSTQTQTRMFFMCLTTLQMLLTLSLSSTNIILFFIMFEATLIPTMIIITRWGSQKERLTAGMYFMFYTLISSMPLLIALLTMNYQMDNLNTMLTSMTTYKPNTIMWLACTMAFMVKMPLYGLHLWLPKAHVEAPIAGSMILAAILLKLGGYGMMRISPMLCLTKTLYYPFIIMALWGMIMTSLICLRQPDLKSLIAYSSVSHMGLVVTATMIQTPSSLSGAMILMVAHGITSSMLFCLANMMYERTHTRTLAMMQGIQTTLPLVTAFWLIANLTNMAIPPTINLMGEITITTTMFNWSPPTLILTGSAATITAIYSMYMFSAIQQGKTQKDMVISPPQTREYLVLILHTMPMILLMVNPQIITLS